MNGGALVGGDLVGAAWIVEMFVHACKPSDFFFPFFFFFLLLSFLSGRSFRSPREAVFGVGWALAVEIWYSFLFVSWVTGFGGL